MTVSTIDVAQDVRPALSRLKHAGVTRIIRYDCRLPRGRWKEATDSEWRAIAEAGFELGVVNEGVGNVAGAFTEETGYLDALYSRGRAARRRQPAGSAVYFAVDFDADHAAVVNHVIPYMKGVRRAFTQAEPTLPLLKAGAYCNGLAAATLLQEGLADFTWITCSRAFCGSEAFVEAHREDLWQFRCDVNWFGLSVDYNLSPTGIWGQFRPDGAPPPPAATEPQVAADWNPAWGPRVGKATWYADSTNADGTPVDNEADLSAAMRGVPFGTRVKVTRVDRHDEPSVVVTIHDRGPFVPGRIIDLRRRPAEQLDMLDAGVVAVKLDLIPHVDYTGEAVA
jgi:hypothetical protein